MRNWFIKLENLSDENIVTLLRDVQDCSIGSICNHNYSDKENCFGSYYGDVDFWWIDAMDFINAKEFHTIEEVLEIIYNED